MAEIDRQFLDTLLYGVRQMTWHLRAKGWTVNVKRVRRLMRLMCLMGLMKPILTALRKSRKSAETPEGVASL